LIVSFYEGAMWISNNIVAVYENGLWETTYHVVTNFNNVLIRTILSTFHSIQDSFEDIYYNGLWNSLGDFVSWIKINLNHFSQVVLQSVFFVREMVAQIAGMMDQAMLTIFAAKDVVGDFIAKQIHGILAARDTIISLVERYSEITLAEALKRVAVDVVDVLNAMLSWIARNARAFATIYQTVSSHALSHFKPYLSHYIPETYIDEIFQDLNGMITWFADVVMVTRLVTTWVCHNVAMVLLKMLEVVDPTTDVTKVASAYGSDDFWNAARMNLLESAVMLTRTLVACFLGSKMVKVIMRGLVAYGDAIFSRESMMYNVIVLSTFACIYVVCRMRCRIEQIYCKVMYRYSGL